jgi:hypothetical protein
MAELQIPRRNSTFGQQQQPRLDSQVSIKLVKPALISTWPNPRHSLSGGLSYWLFLQLLHFGACKSDVVLKLFSVFDLEMKRLRRCSEAWWEGSRLPWTGCWQKCTRERWICEGSKASQQPPSREGRHCVRACKHPAGDGSSTCLNLRAPQAETGTSLLSSRPARGPWWDHVSQKVKTLEDINISTRRNQGMNTFQERPWGLQEPPGN